MSHFDRYFTLRSFHPSVHLRPELFIGFCKHLHLVTSAQREKKQQQLLKRGGSSRGERDALEGLPGYRFELIDVECRLKPCTLSLCYGPEATVLRRVG